MTATRTAVLSARVPEDMRADYEELARRAGTGDLSVPMRRALREYADRELGRTDGHAPAAGVALLMGGQGAARARATSTERDAALAVAPRVGTQRRRALDEYERAGARGLTADDVIARLDLAAGGVGTYAANGIARRVTDLLQGELIIERMAPPGELEPGEDRTPEGVLTRRTRHGAQATVYRITAAGLRALEDARAREAARR